jgi:hypothetical protein
MKVTRHFRILGQSLWLDTITRDLLSRAILQHAESLS